MILIDLTYLAILGMDWCWKTVAHGFESQVASAAISIPLALPLASYEEQQQDIIAAKKIMRCPSRISAVCHVIQTFLLDKMCTELPDDTYTSWRSVELWHLFDLQHVHAWLAECFLQNVGRRSTSEVADPQSTTLYSIFEWNEFADAWNIRPPHADEDPASRFCGSQTSPPSCCGLRFLRQDWSSSSKLGVLAQFWPIWRKKCNYISQVNSSHPRVVEVVGSNLYKPQTSNPLGFRGTMVSRISAMSPAPGQPSLDVSRGERLGVPSVTSESFIWLWWFKCSFTPISHPLKDDSLYCQYTACALPYPKAIKGIDAAYYVYYYTPLESHFLILIRQNGPRPKGFGNKNLTTKWHQNHLGSIGRRSQP